MSFQAFALLSIPAGIAIVTPTDGPRNNTLTRRADMPWVVLCSDKNYEKWSGTFQLDGYVLTVGSCCKFSIFWSFLFQRASDIFNVSSNLPCFQDSVSSFEIEGGGVIQLCVGLACVVMVLKGEANQEYSDINCREAPIAFNHDVVNFREYTGWNDQVSSFITFWGSWEECPINGKWAFYVTERLTSYYST